MAPDPSHGVPAALSGSHVVVAAGARFYADATADKPLASRSYKHDQPEGIVRAHHLGWVMALEEVGERRVRVAPLAGDEPATNCGQGMEGLGAYALGVWVDRDQLLPVTTAATRLRFSDGSALSLPPGTPILPAADDQPRRISAWGFELNLDEVADALLDPEDLKTGSSFTLAEGQPFPDESLPWPEKAMTLAGKRFYDIEGAEKAKVVASTGDSAQLRTRCLDIEAHIGEGEAPMFFGSIGSGNLGGGGYLNAKPRLYAAPAGSEVRWPDGSRAGTLRGALRALDNEAPGEGFCSYVHVGDGSQDLILCLDPDDVTRLSLGVAKASEGKVTPSGGDRLAPSDLDFHARSLRVPCISYAIERDPELAATLHVRGRYGPLNQHEPAALTLTVREGKIDDELKRCLQREIAAWNDFRIADRTLEFDLEIAAKERP